MSMSRFLKRNLIDCVIVVAAMAVAVVTLLAGWPWQMYLLSGGALYCVGSVRVTDPMFPKK